MKHRILTVAILLAGTALSPAAHADYAPPSMVGRISYLSGTVSTHGPDADNWNYATLNSPVTSGNSFWTEPKARGEIQAGPMEIRLDQGTEVDVSRLDESGTELNVPQGIVNIHLHAVPPGGVRVDTPQGQMVLDRVGSYDIDAGDPGDDTTPQPQQVQVSVLEGQARVTASNASFLVEAGEAATINGNAPVRIGETQATPFDDWALAREHRERPGQALQYVSADETGYQDLDNYGTWSPAPDYGTVWYPNNVPQNWAPYSDGRWDYVQPWGWTWVDNAPWGFTPFHYGRWVQSRGRWGWWPGQHAERPVYAPALVAFLGGGVSIGIGEQPVGWVPLAPYEVYRPWYARNEGYWRDVNRPYVRDTQINNITINNYNNGPRYYANHYANAEHGATFVHSDDFRRGGRIHGSDAGLRPASLAETPVAGREVHDMRPDTAHSDGHGSFAHRDAPTPPGNPHTEILHGQGATAPAERAFPAHIGTPMGAGSGAPGPRFGHGNTPPATNAPAGNDRHDKDRHGFEQPTLDRHADTGTPTPIAAAPSQAGDHAPGPAMHRGGTFGGNRPDAGNRPVFAPNQEAPHAFHQAEQGQAVAPSEPDRVTTAREREDNHRPPTEWRSESPATPPPHIEAPHAEAPHVETPHGAEQTHQAQPAPLSATPHGWQRGDGHEGGNHTGGHAAPAHQENHAQGQHAAAPPENHGAPNSNDNHPGQH